MRALGISWRVPASRGHRASSSHLPRPRHTDAPNRSRDFQHTPCGREKPPNVDACCEDARRKPGPQPKPLETQVRSSSSSHFLIPISAGSAVESRDRGWVGRGPTESGRWGGTVPPRGTSDPTSLSSVCSRRRNCKSEESTAGVPTLSVGPLIHTSDPTLHRTLVITRAKRTSALRTILQHPAPSSPSSPRPSRPAETRASREH